MTDRRATAGRPLAEVVRAALAGVPARWRGVAAVQLREKDLPARELTALAHQLRAVTADAGAPLYVNGRVDVALAVGADGVHLGGGALAPDDVRRVVPAPAFGIGVSTHARDDVWSAARSPHVRFAVFGPVWDTPSKRALGRPVGLERLRDAATLGVPLLALGGVTPARARDCLDAGAWGVACVRAILEAADPAETVAAFIATLG